MEAVRHRWGWKRSTAHSTDLSRGGGLELRVEVRRGRRRSGHPCWARQAKSQHYLSRPIGCVIPPRTRPRRPRPRTAPSRRSRCSSRAAPPGSASCRGRPGPRPPALAPPERGQPAGEVLSGLPLFGEPADDAHGRLGARLGRQAHGPLAELDLGLAHVTAEQQLVAGGGPAVGPPLGPVEPDVGDVVLAAAVGAARDVDPHAADIGQAGLLERLADVVGQAAALGDGQVAGVGTRAGRRRRGPARRRARPCRWRPAGCRARAAGRRSGPGRPGSGGW